jgi:hypothetical protein
VQNRGQDLGITAMLAARPLERYAESVVMFTVMERAGIGAHGAKLGGICVEKARGVKNN